MTCPYCAYALANAGSPCPRCNQAIGVAPPAIPPKASANNTRHLSTTQNAPGSLHSQAQPSSPQEVKPIGNVTPLSAIVVIGMLFGIVCLLNKIIPDSGHSSASISPPVARSQAIAPTPTAVVMGPTFQQVDSMMDDRRIDLTDAQRQQYWNTVVGTVITWTGIVHNVYLDGGGQLSLQCNPASILSDVRVSLDGTQMSLLPQIRKGQQVTVRAILDNHHAYGYNLVQGQIMN